MAWIEVHQELFRHRKTVSLAAALSVSRITAAGHMISLWVWSLDNAPDGDLSGIESSVVAFGAEWPWDPDDFMKATITSGFLDITDDLKVITIHDWMDYAGKLIDRRKANTERKRQARLTDAPATGARQPQPSEATVPNRTVPNRTSSSNEEVSSSDVQSPEAQTVEYPPWFMPMVDLDGFKNTKHQGSIKTILQGCTDAKVDPSRVVQSFADYYKNGGKAQHGWLDPVAALRKTLPVQIKKVQGGFTNGRRASGREIYHDPNHPNAEGLR